MRLYIFSSHTFSYFLPALFSPRLFRSHRTPSHTYTFRLTSLVSIVVPRTFTPSHCSSFTPKCRSIVIAVCLKTTPSIHLYTCFIFVPRTLQLPLIPLPYPCSNHTHYSHFSLLLPFVPTGFHLTPTTSVSHSLHLFSFYTLTLLPSLPITPFCNHRPPILQPPPLSNYSFLGLPSFPFS